MRLTEQQAFSLFVILKDTLYVEGYNFGNYNNELRCKLYTDILNQQSNTIIDLKDENNELS